MLKHRQPEPTHFRQNTHSYINLNITGLYQTLPNLIVESGVHTPLYQNCQHELIYGIKYFQIPSQPHYKRRVWKYNKANFNSLRSDLNLIDWYEEFRDLDSNEAANSFLEKFFGLISNHIPNFEMLCNAKDPPWITKSVKSAICRKHKIYKKYVKNGKRSSGKDNGRACPAQHDQFSYLKLFFSMPIMDEKYLICVEYFNEIIHLLNDIVCKPFPQCYIAPYLFDSLRYFVPFRKWHETDKRTIVKFRSCIG